MEAGIEHHVEEEEQQVFPKLRSDGPDAVESMADPFLAKRKSLGMKVNPVALSVGATKEQLIEEAQGVDIEGTSSAAAAEATGFDFVSISDHYHPWVGAQGHSPFVWSVLGGIAEATDRIQVGVGVTCPTIRIHPAVIAQATATTSLLLRDRFFFGVGTGEALNEHVLGDRWPRPELRLEMLEEAVELIRRLWTGETVDHRGTHYEVENARLLRSARAGPPDRGVRVRRRRGGARGAHR